MPLKICLRQRWIDWEDQGPGVRLMLAPLTASRRSELVEQATEQPQDPANPRKRLPARLNAKRYNALIADECIHGWEGLVCDDGDGTPSRPLPYSKEQARQLMDLDLVSVFVFQQVLTMGLVTQRDEDAAGKGCAGAPIG